MRTEENSSECSTDSTGSSQGSIGARQGLDAPGTTDDPEAPLDRFCPEPAAPKQEIAPGATDNATLPSAKDLGLLLPGTEEGQRVRELLEASQRDAEADPELGRRKQRNDADLQARYNRQHRRDPGQAACQEGLIHDARKYAESYLADAYSSEGRLKITRKIWDDFIPKHPNRGAFGLKFESLHSAVWNEGVPSLEERANGSAEVDRVAVSRSTEENPSDDSTESSAPARISELGRSDAPTKQESPKASGLADVFLHLDMAFEGLTDAGLANIGRVRTEEIYLNTFAEFGALCEGTIAAEFPTGKPRTQLGVRAAVVKLSLKLGELAETYFSRFIDAIGKMCRGSLQAGTDPKLTERWRQAVINEYAGILWRDVGNAWLDWLDHVREITNGASFAARIRAGDDQEALTLSRHQQHMTNILGQIVERHSLSDKVARELTLPTARDMVLETANLAGVPDSEKMKDQPTPTGESGDERLGHGQSAMKSSVLNLVPRNSARLADYPKSDAQLPGALARVSGYRPTLPPEPSPLAGGGHQKLTKWEDLDIVFLSDRQLQMRIAGDAQPPLNYAEMGFANKKNDNPKAAWDALWELALRNGVYTKASGSRRWVQVEKRIEEIRRIFKERFGLADDPLPFTKKSRRDSSESGYKARFRIRCHPASGIELSEISSLI